jgi:predicted extracellular nuclease
MRLSLLAAASATLLFSSSVLADTTAQTLPFSQNWSNTGLITVVDNWSGVPGIEGYLGQDITTGTGADPQPLTATSAVANDLDVIANQTNTGSTNGGVAEFDGIANPVIALQGSGTADAPHIIVNLNTTGASGITVAYVLRDLDGTADNAVQAVALQYRVGNSGAFINIPAGFVADATTGPSLATLVTTVSATLPAGAENQSLVQLRIITANAAGNDEWVGIDDLSVTAGTAPLSVSVADVSVNEGDTGTTNAVFTVLLNQSAPVGGVSVDIATSDGTATVADGDYAAASQNGLLIAQGSSSATVTVSVTGDSRIEPNESFTLTLSNPTGGATLSDGVAIGTIRNDDFATASIHAIQGTGSQSPRVGEDLATEGIVTAIKNNGFFIQTPAAEADADPLTSQGLFVFTSTPPTADATVGNRVRVFGRVTEFAFSDTTSRSLPITQLAGNSGAGVVLSITVLSTGNAIPAPTDLQASDLAPGNALEAMERFEGMRVRAPALVTVAPTNAVLSETNATAADTSSGANGVFFATLAGVPRPLREPGLDPDELVSTTAPVTVPRFDNNTEMLRVDSDAQTGAAKVRADAGAPISNLVGVIDYAFNYYSLLPDAGQLQVDANGYLLGGRSPAAVPDASRDLATIGGFNLLRFFDDVNDPAIGEPVLTGAALTKRLDQTAEAVCRYVRAPDILGVVEVENLSVLTALANRINALAVSTPSACPYNPQYEARLSEGNDVGGIDVGYLISTREVRTGVPRVSILEVTQFGKDTLFTNPNASTELLNDRPPLLLKAVVNNANGAAEPVTVIINHMRSLGGVSDTAAGSSGWATSGERVRAKRGEQALYLAQLIQQRQQADANERLVLLGDFNVFEFNDGLVDGMGIITGREASAAQVLRYVDSPITNPLTVLTPLSSREEQYSFSFDGNAQSLDHAVVNQRTLDSLLSVKAEHARINADFSEMRFGTGALRVSDHDPVVLYLGAASFRSVDLRAQVTAAATSVNVGQNLGWNVSVSSVSGSDAAPSPSVRFTLNRVITNMSVTAPAGWSCTAPAASGGNTESLCTASSLAAAASANFAVAIPDSTGFALGGVQLTAVAASNGTETAPSDNTANATVTLTGNRAPVFTGTPALSGTPQAGQRLSVVNTATTDADSDPVTLSYVWQRNGTPISGATQPTYLLLPGDRGQAIRAVLTASDGVAQVNATTAAFTVVNAAPSATNDSYALVSGDTLDVPAPGVLGNDSDAEGDVLSAQMLAGPLSGTATVSANGRLQYTPNGGFVGTDSLTYRACDAQDCATASVQFTIAAPALPFATRDDRFVVLENSAALLLDVAANDVIDAPRRVAGRLELVQGPAFGTASIDTAGTPASAADDRIRYQPNADRSGEDAFSYRLCEGGVSNRCSEALVQVITRPLTDAALTFDVVGNAGQRRISIDSYRATTDARLTTTPLVAPTITETLLGADSTPETPWDAGGRNTIIRTLPQVGQARDWRVLVDARTLASGNVDIYVGVDANGDGQASTNELRCASAMSANSERCELALSVSANSEVRYWVLAHNPANTGHTARVEMFEVPVIASNGSLNATAQAAAARRSPWDLRLAWNDPSLLDGEPRVGYVALRNAPGETPAWMPVRITRRGGAAGATALVSGRDFTLRLAPNEEQGRLYIDVPPGSRQLDITTSSTQAFDLRLVWAPSPTANAAAPVVNDAPDANAESLRFNSTAGTKQVGLSAPRAGRWYLVPINASNGPVEITLRATLIGTAPVVRPGGYFNTARSGHGLFLYPAAADWAGLWYTYLQDGTPTWYYLQGAAPTSNGQWQATLYRSSWNGTANTLTAIGSAIASPTGADAFTFSYTLDGETGSEAFSSFGRGCPSVGGSALNVSSHWFNPARSGTGYSVQLFNNYEFYAVFGYDAAGVARFLVAERSTAGGANETLTLEQLTGFCPLCNRSGNPVRTPIGSFQRSFAGGTFSNISLNGSFVGGVPGTWAANDAVVPLGGGSSVQGCSIP